MKLQLFLTNSLWGIAVSVADALLRALLHAIAIQASIHLPDHGLYVERDSQERGDFSGDCLRFAQHAMIMHARDLHVRLAREPLVHLDQVALKGLFDRGC